MKTITKILVISSLVVHAAYSKAYTFYDLQNLMNAKYGVTLVVDKDIADEYIIYSDNLKRDATLQEIKSMALDAGYKYKKSGNFINITKKSKAEQKAIDRDIALKQKRKEHELQMQFKEDEKEFTEDDFFTDGVITDLPRKAVMAICKQMNYDCTYISNGAYLIRSKNDIVDLALFHKYEAGKQYALMGTITEINKNKLKDKHIDINAFVSTLLTSNYLDLNLIGEYGSYFQNSITPDNKISVSALFKFFTSNGIAKVTSKPYLILEDDEKTRFSTGQTLTVAASVVTNNEKGISQTNYSTVQVGLQIEVMPQFAKSYIYLDLNLDISSLLDYDKEKNIANIANRSLSGKYRLTPGREIKIVGFEQTYQNKKNFKVPLLGDLPVVGELFKSHYRDDKDTLLLVSFKLVKVGA